MFKSFSTLFILLFLISCGDSVKKKEYKSPDDQYGPLFRDVQLLPVFQDSKTFTDCVPKYDPATLLKAYEKEKSESGFDLKAFVSKNFIIPQQKDKHTKDTTLSAYAQHFWPSLTYAPKDDGGSLIHLRKPYLVPGGRFREAHYADTYFMMLGLKAQQKDTLIENMVLNFAQLIQDFGHVPAGNRSYYVSRSHPPYFSLMVEMLADLKKDEQVYVRNTSQLLKEYQYWMASESKEEAIKQTEARTTRHKAYRKAVLLDNDQVLNRYFDELNTPRPEAYKEDVAAARKSGRKPEEVYKELRAAGESGWDLSSRWMTGHNLHTTHIVPVDLNALLYKLELVLAKAYRVGKQESYARSMENLAAKRKAIFDQYFWNEEKGFYFDYDFEAKKQTGVYSLAAVYPLYFGLASPGQAEKVAKMLKEKFLKRGGLLTTLHNSGQDWDSPQGWAPLQYMAIHGLQKYGYKQLADEIRTRWINTNELIFKKTGQISGAYNVVNPDLAPPFSRERAGWTNGVLLALFAE